MCMIAHDDVASTVCETQVTLRCAETHAYHVQAVKENPDNAAIYGVTGPSVFQRLDYFDVVQGFPPDIMHDCCEGVMPGIVYGIVKHLVDEKITTVSCINQKIASFVFHGADRVNKPELFRSDCSIIGSASQKMCLFRLLPFFVDLVSYVVAKFHELWSTNGSKPDRRFYPPSLFMLSRQAALSGNTSL